MSLRPTLDFLIYDWLEAESLTQRVRFADHSRETFDAVLETCERIAREKYAPHNRTVDIQEPHFDGDKVVLPQATHDAHKAFAESGMLSAAQDYEIGGMQLPYLVQSAANSFFAMASVSIGSGMLTTGNANLLLVHGTPMQQSVFARNEFSGRWSGTMCLSEPQAGSSLSDVATRAVPDGAGSEDDPLGPRYRLFGNKMWISSGDHELTENIVHIVLAKIPDDNGRLVPGTRGISLFIVPKWLVKVQSPHPGPLPHAGEGVVGSVTVTLGSRNDVALAGLNHKLGWRGTTNTLLNFGEGKFPVDGKAGAVGYLVGQPGKGLHCMFHMMNEARIGVGLAATMLGMAGYHASLDYAKNRPQGRLVQKAGAGTGGAVVKDAAQPQVRIIEHADVRRMLLAQKAYCEGALALELYCARLVDEQKTGEAKTADDARLLLEVLTPIAKSWPSEWCLEANSLAIQVHGGYGYTRDFNVEQYWRDQRLNPIHEGTHGIQALDLLGRKMRLAEGQAWQALRMRIEHSIARAADIPSLGPAALALQAASQRIAATVTRLFGAADLNVTLANATAFLEAFGHVVVAWVWLDQAIVAARALPQSSRSDADFYRGKLQAAAWFFRWELPRTGPWLDALDALDVTALEMHDAWF
jgi:alkylation response protein AidB-like acyl-CoA dehydrogenase